MLSDGDTDMAGKGKSAEEIIAALREAEVRIAQGETVGKICRQRPTSSLSTFQFEKPRRYIATKGAMLDTTPLEPAGSNGHNIHRVMWNGTYDLGVWIGASSNFKRLPRGNIHNAESRRRVRLCYAGVG